MYKFLVYVQMKWELIKYKHIKIMLLIGLSTFAQKSITAITVDSTTQQSTL